MGCLEPEDKRTIIDESDLEVTRLVVSEEELSQFPYSLEPIRNFSVVNPQNINQTLHQQVHQNCYLESV